MKRVPTGELPFWLRNAATTQLTRNPERASLGVLAFMASLVVVAIEVSHLLLQLDCPSRSRFASALPYPG